MTHETLFDRGEKHKDYLTCSGNLASASMTLPMMLEVYQTTAFDKAAVIVATCFLDRVEMCFGFILSLHVKRLEENTEIRHD